MDRPPTKTIRWYNLWRWALETAVVSRRAYASPPRPWTAGRLPAFLRPNLERPVFIVGAPRSGTTFLGDCLGQLPTLSYHYEPILTKAAARYVYEERWHLATARRIYRTTYAWLMRLGGDPDLRFAEKTPRNCFIMPFLASTFEEARFIHIIRDGRDAALSRRAKQWVRAAPSGRVQYEPGGYPYGPYPRFWIERDRADEYEQTTDLHRCIWDWRRHVEAARMAGARFPDAYLEVRYEPLMRTPEVEVDRILHFLELDRPDSRKHLRSALADGHTRSIGRWQSTLGDEERRLIVTEAGALLRELGYGWTDTATL
jgi:hypothetical protein